ncbi:hypothetical protein sos41_31580 [Alphaproteobacteria bacterium SO-S41]|nr:hypothetical protein sos41_31580 [Alphaproteobacteria bacterium SO-S41]
MITESVKTIRGLVENTKAVAAGGISYESLIARLDAVLRHCSNIDIAIETGRLTDRVAFSGRIAARDGEVVA